MTDTKRETVEELAERMRGWYRDNHSAFFIAGGIREWLASYEGCRVVGGKLVEEETPIASTLPPLQETIAEFESAGAEVHVLGDDPREPPAEPPVTDEHRALADELASDYARCRRDHVYPQRHRIEELIARHAATWEKARQEKTQATLLRLKRTLESRVAERDEIAKERDALRAKLASNRTALATTLERLEELSLQLVGWIDEDKPIPEPATAEGSE